MVQYENQYDYSMPHQCGLFPPPPYEYKKARGIFVVFQCAIGIKEKKLPPELEPIEYGFDVIGILEYPETTIGPYNESIIFLNCKHRDTPGEFVFNIYVDDDVALTAGREIWGYPKKMCDIKLSPIQDNKVRGTLTRKGITFLDVEVELLDNPPGLDPKEMFANMPLYNLKLIPDVADNSKPVLRQITGTNLEMGEFYKNLAININYVKSEYSQYDICHEILKDADKNLGGFYIESDFVLPNGRVLE